VDVETTETGSRGAITAFGERAAFELPVHGAHNVMNALAAVGGALVLGDALGPAAEALATFEPVGGRSAVRRIGDLRVIDDTYNANPASMARALETVVALARRDGTRAYAALGHMRELGDRSAAHHEDVGAHAAEAGVQAIIILGENAEDYARGARGKGLQDVAVAGSHTEVVRALLERCRPGDWILVKGSRGARMEAVVEELEACSTT